MEGKKVKRPKFITNSSRLPAMGQCEKCKYQDLCEGGRFCISDKIKKREKK